MLTIKSNSRQVPSSKEILSNANYCDLLYCHLQNMSSRDSEKSNCRYIQKRDINFSTIAEQLGMSRQTVSKKFKAMLEEEENSLSLIKYDKNEKKYYLIDLDKSISTLVEHNTLLIMTSCLQERVISIYVYLLNRYFANRFQQFQYTLPELKTALGLGCKSSGNNYIINSALITLKKLGLIDYRQELVKEKGKHEKTCCFITWMTNELDDLPQDLNDERIQVSYKNFKAKFA